MTLQVGALLLGAGFSRRFGSDKRLHQWQDKPIAAHTAALYTQVFDSVRVVIRAEDEALASLLHGYDVELVFAKDAQLGMGHSLAAGMQNNPWDWTVVGLLDMPFVQPSTLQRLLSFVQKTQCPVVRFGQPTDRPPAHPVAWHRRLYPELAQAQGDQGGRDILQRHLSEVAWLPCDDPGIYQDIDRPTDLP